MMNSLSIVIPVYNGWKYMKKCLDALENQTVKPDEVIIGDDCSTDDTYEQLEKFIISSSLKIVLFRNESNKGPGYTRNVAKNIATSEYVLFCDADDWYELDLIECVKKSLNEKKADLVIFDSYTVIGEKKRIAGVTNNLKADDINSLLALYPMSLCRFAVHKKILDTINFPALYNGEDGAVVPQIIAKSKVITIINKPLYNYFTRLGSASLKPSEKVFKGLVDSYEIIYHYLHNSFADEIEFIGIKNICYGAVLNALKVKLERKNIKSIILEFERKYPEWEKNKYISTLPLYKKIFINCVKRRWILSLKALTKIHSILICTWR